LVPLPWPWDPVIRSSPPATKVDEKLDAFDNARTIERQRIASLLWGQMPFSDRSQAVFHGLSLNKWLNGGGQEKDMPSNMAFLSLIDERNRIAGILKKAFDLVDGLGIEEVIAWIANGAGPNGPGEVLKS
jgi:hypothetical protein